MYTAAFPLLINQTPLCNQTLLTRLAMNLACVLSKKSLNDSASFCVTAIAFSLRTSMLLPLPRSFTVNVVLFWSQ